MQYSATLVVSDETINTLMQTPNNPSELKKALQAAYYVGTAGVHKVNKKYLTEIVSFLAMRDCWDDVRKDSYTFTRGMALLAEIQRAIRRKLAR